MGHFFSKPFTLDSTVRLFIVSFIAISIILLFRYLSPILLPFFVAWLFAYLLHPIVIHIQRKFRIKNRSIVVILLILFITSTIITLFYFLIPILIDEFTILKDFLFNFAKGKIESNDTWQQVLQNFFNSYDIPELLSQNGFLESVSAIFPHFGKVVSSSLNIIIGLFSAFVTLLYLFFILKDYNTITKHFIGLVPNRYQNFVSTLMNDLEQGMNNYYRGQFLVALIVGILFSIGFSIIGMPLGILMGILVGLLNLVPYLQIAGIPPCILLMLVHSIETGNSPIYGLIGLAIVFVVVQIIQDAFLVPKIMGKQMGLNAAIILLSLSIFGMLFGLVGLIIALPITTLLLSYYKRYVLKTVNAEYQRQTRTEDPETIEQLRN